MSAKDLMWDNITGGTCFFVFFKHAIFTNSIFLYTSKQKHLEHNCTIYCIKKQYFVGIGNELMYVGGLQARTRQPSSTCAPPAVTSRGTKCSNSTRPCTGGWGTFSRLAHGRKTTILLFLTCILQIASLPAKPLSPCPISHGRKTMILLFLTCILQIASLPAKPLSPCPISRGV